MYYIRTAEGRKRHSTRIGKNRGEAQRALNRTEVNFDEGNFQAPRRIIFTAWAEEWIDSLEHRETTIARYGSTMDYAGAAFGAKEVRRLGVDDVRRLNASMRDAGPSDSTGAKHLRVLGACLAAAIPAGYSARNPVRELGARTALASPQARGRILHERRARPAPARGPRGRLRRRRKRRTTFRASLGVSLPASCSVQG